MKKRITIILSLVLFGCVLTGCGKANTDATTAQTTTAPVTTIQTADEQTTAEQTTAAQATNSQVTESTGSDSRTGASSLSELRKAAANAGYYVSDGYDSSYMKEVIGGFSVHIVADGKDRNYAIMECKTEAAAIKNCKTRNDAGYDIAIRNGRIFTYYGVEDKNGTGKDILTSIVMGTPIAKP